MTSLIILSAVALAPGAYLAKAMYLKDKYEPEPKRLLLGAFVVGCLVALVAGILNAVAQKALGVGTLGKLGILGAFVMAFLVVGPIEEGVKFWALRYYAFPKRDFNEPFDGIVYSSFIALGFATLENVAYVFEDGLGVGVMRMFTAVPGHYAYGVIMGYFVGKAKFELNKRGQYMLLGFLYAALLHGAYDFFVMQGVYPPLVLFTPAVLIVALVIARRAIKELQADSQWRFTPLPLPSSTIPPVIPVPLVIASEVSAGNVEAETQRSQQSSFPRGPG